MVSGVGLLIVFQFNYCTIKRDDISSEMGIMQGFQFNYCTIKSVDVIEKYTGEKLVSIQLLYD